MGITTDPNDPGLKETRPDGMQKTYLVLSDEVRAKGSVRPIRNTYRHLKCGITTTVGHMIAETYAIDPAFYSQTYCRACGAHFPLKNPDGSPAFTWEPDGSAVGS